MRSLTLAILAIATVAAAGQAAAQTYAPGYPVCLHVYGPVTYYECAYTSLPQCSLSASGRAAHWPPHARSRRAAARRRTIPPADG